MKYFIISTFSLLFFLHKGIVQEIAFKHYYPIDSIGTHGIIDLIVTNDTVIGLGQAIVDTSFGQWGIVVSMFDSSGLLIDHEIIKDDSLFHGFLLNGDYHNIIKTSDGGYAFTCAVTGRLSALLVKLDNELNVEFIKEYNGGEFSWVDFAVHETETGYVISGSLENTEEKVVPFVWHVDKQGEPIWEKYYGEGISFSNGRISDVAVSDGQIYAIGHYSSPQRTFIEVLDMDGEVLRSWVSGANPEEGRLKRIVDVVGQDLITYGWYYKDIINGIPYIRPNFFRFGEDLEIEWTHRMEFVTVAGQDNEFDRFTKTQDGHYLAIGVRRYDFGGNGEFGQGGWLHQFSPLGDSLWSGHVEIPEPDYDHNRGGFSGGGVLSSGNVICGGRFVQGPQSYPWLVKLNCSDSLFCGEPFVSDVGEELDEAASNIYPNPADAELTVEHFGVPNASVEIIDLRGITVLHQILTHEAQKSVVNLSVVPSGIYFVKILQGQDLLQVEKLLIGH